MNGYKFSHQREKQNVNNKTFLIIFLEIDLRIEVINAKSADLKTRNMWWALLFSPTLRWSFPLFACLAFDSPYCVEEVVE